MNEKILELAEHCDFYVGNEHYDKSYEEKQRLFMEKFAELIVAECMQIIKVDMYEDAISNMWSKNKLQMIKEHFGVEE